jgi:hypothetical protein
MFASLERGVGWSRVRSTKKSFYRLVVSHRRQASVSAEIIPNENNTRQLKAVIAQVLPASDAPSRSDARAEHGVLQFHRWLGSGFFESALRALFRLKHNISSRL